MREWRKGRELNETQKWKDGARSMAGVYRRRGKLIPELCEGCGAEDVEMHHENYDRPLDVTWLCKPCHQAHHRNVDT